MYPKPLQRVIDLFMKLPGVGPRQAARFAMFIAQKKGELARELSSAFMEMEQGIDVCARCYRTVEKNGEAVNALCALCRGEKRLGTTVAVVEKESDMHNLEHTGAYQGTYHVLGGVIAPLDADSPKRLHLRELYERIKKTLETNGMCELILGTNPTTEGDTTALYIERIFAPLKTKYPKFVVSRLGRGLSLGSELEYADEMTLRNALMNRK